MRPVLIEPHLFPCIEYFTCICSARELVLETSEHFVKQSYRSRYRINTPAGALTLVVPVTDKSGKVPLRDVRIDYGQRWQNRHWRTLVSGYGNAPYFEHYAEEVHGSLFRKYDTLVAMSKGLMTMCLDSLKLDIALQETPGYREVSDAEFLDLRNTISAKAPWQARRYYRPVAYTQVFGSGFVENLSVLDLLFCTGPDATRIIRESALQNH
jgi:hypothetical protein